MLIANWQIWELISSVLNVNKGCTTRCKLKNTLPLHGAGENNLLLLQTTLIDANEEALADAGTTNLLLPTNKNSTSKNIRRNSARMKCYYHCKQNCLLDCFDDPIPDDTVIYMSDIPFQYNKREARYTEFIGNPTGTIFNS